MLERGHLTQITGCLRKIITLHKEDSEPFGFEIQTYGVHRQDDNTVEMLTFVCRVHKNSVAEVAGLKQGDTIVGINGICVEGMRHKEIVEIIKSCSRFVRLETVYGTDIRKTELETRLQYLKQTLHEKYEEYRSLMVQEQRLVNGIVTTDPTVYDTLESVQAYVYGQHLFPNPALHREDLYRMSTCSSSSCVSTGTDESDDHLYTTCMFDPVEENGTHNRDRHVPVSKPTLSRSASLRTTQNGADYRSRDRVCEQNHFITLPRKSKQKSLRKRLLKFIPGLNKSVEEEESQL
ncbi:protein TAMALIN [Protopterus annectens]|uniref:protein TAMALIN n=1 Tax=Protopterus annectens TaxID=7888 RepID=UPI001CF99A6F|nr:protein TAMALIN [Protopterus annectens]